MYVDLADELAYYCSMAVSERKFFVGGNWKMNGSKGMIDVILDTLNGGNLNTDTGNYFALIY